MVRMLVTDVVPHLWIFSLVSGQLTLTLDALSSTLKLSFNGLFVLPYYNKLTETRKIMAAARDTFTEAHDLYYPLVYGAAYSKVGNADIAEDICQEVFLSFWQKLGEIKDHRTWLLGALRFSVLKHYRKKDGDQVNVDDVFDDVALTFVNGMSDARIVIKQVIDHGGVFKDDIDRVIFDMVAVSQFSYTETAVELGLTKRVVEYRYRKIADTIVSKLREQGVKKLEDIL